MILDTEPSFVKGFERDSNSPDNISDQEKDYLFSPPQPGIYGVIPALFYLPFSL